MCRVGFTKAAGEDGGCPDQEEDAKSGHTCLTAAVTVPFPAMGGGGLPLPSTARPRSGLQTRKGFGEKTL
jgi:hypothetical protein